MSPKSKKSYVPKRLGRRADQMRPVKLELDYIPTADGSCLISFGRTRVICTASITPGVPPWMAGSGRGWVTAEYGMLPASTSQRKSRPIGGKPDGRGTEIQRLIGRVLRGAVRTDRLGENTIYLDCDVITADGGTRTAAITGAYIALARALAAGKADGRIPGSALAGSVAAVSVGIVDGRCLLDLDYSEDSRAQVDMNVAMTAAGRFVEVQASAERAAFTQDELSSLLRLARRGCRQLAQIQRQAIK
jgi:ribonuclease PH